MDKVIQRHDTAARWKQYNPILSEGELGLETDTHQYKTGDGINHWNDLEYNGFNCLNQTGNSTVSPMNQAATTKELNKRFVYGGTVYPTSSVSPTESTMYFASTDGTYSSCGSLTLENEAAFLCYDATTKTWTKYNIDVATTQQIADIEDQIFSLEVKLSALSTVVEFTSSDVYGGVVFSIYYKNALVTPATLNYNHNNAAAKSLTVKSSGSFTTANALTEGANTIKVNATYKTSTGGVARTLSASNTITINAVRAMYFGFSAAEGTDDLTVTGLTKQSLKTSPAGTYTLTNPADGDYVWFCVPSSMTINKVTLNGFDVPMNGYVTKTVNGATYRCYRNSNALTAKSYTFVIS